MTDPALIRERVRQKLHEQRALVHALLAQREQLKASLFVRYGECGKPQCACRSGRRHGPYYVLSARGDAGSAFVYLGSEDVPRARRLVNRYREYRRDLRKLKQINLELVDLLRRYQEETTRAGGKRLGVQIQKSMIS